MTTRASGRAVDELRNVVFERDFTEMADGSVLVQFGRTRAVHRVGRRAHPAVVEGLGQGLGHRRVLDAAGLVARARRARSGAGQAERAHAGDPAPDRPVAARRRRPAPHARRADHRRLRRAAGRRRHPHRVDLRWLDRVARRVQPPGRQGHARASSDPATVRGDLGGRHRRHADARPRVRRGRAGRSRHERGDDRRRAVRRGAGNRRRRRVHAQRARRAARPRRAGIEEIIAAQREMVAEPPAPRAR